MRPPSDRIMEKTIISVLSAVFEVKLEFRKLRGELVRIEILAASSFVPHLMAYNFAETLQSPVQPESARHWLIIPFSDEHVDISKHMFPHQRDCNAMRNHSFNCNWTFRINMSGF